MIRVLIQASSAVTQAGLETLLRAHPSIDVLESAAAIGPARARNSEEFPDVVLAEMESPDVELERDLLEWSSAGSAVILLAHRASAEWISEMLRAGVRAVLPSNVAGPEIVASIEAAFAGLVVVHPNDLDALVPSHNSLSEPALRTLAEPLTSRETEVLQLLAQGLANKEIAGRLSISEHTAKFHVAAIMGKLGASSRTEAVTLGIRHGLVMI
jgi:DNA-binding NarL/FixJ family response regulator